MVFSAPVWDGEDQFFQGRASLGRRRSRERFLPAAPTTSAYSSKRETSRTHARFRTAVRYHDPRQRSVPVATTGIDGATDADEANQGAPTALA